MKKRFGLFLLLVMSFSFVACSGPSGVVENAFVALKNQDYSLLQTYFVETRNNTEEDNLSVEESKNQVLSQLLAELKFEIISQTINEDNNTAVVSVAYEYLDNIDLLAKVFKAAVRDVFSSDASNSGTNSQNGGYEHILAEVLQSEDLKRISRNVEIQLVKEEDTWLIKGYDSFTAFVLDGLNDIFK